MDGVGTSLGSAKAGAAAAAHTFAFADLPPIGALGIGEMMQYLSSYLDDSDAKIRASMNEVKNSKDASEKLGQMMTKLQSIAAQAKDGWVKDPDALAATKDLLNSNSELRKTLPPEALEALDRIGSHLGDTTIAMTFHDHDSSGDVMKGGSYGGGMGTHYDVDAKEVSDAKVSKDDIDRAVEALKTESSALASANELKMIQLQSAISARGNLLSMVSNMVKSFDDNAKSIVGNMR